MFFSKRRTQAFGSLLWEIIYSGTGPCSGFVDTARVPQRPEGLQQASEQMSGAEAAQLTGALIVLWHGHGIQSELVSGVNLKVLPNVPVTRFKLA